MRRLGAALAVVVVALTATACDDSAKRNEDNVRCITEHYGEPRLEEICKN